MILIVIKVKNAIWKLVIAKPCAKRIVIVTLTSIAIKILEFAWNIAIQMRIATMVTTATGKANVQSNVCKILIVSKMNIAKSTFLAQPNITQYSINVMLYYLLSQIFKDLSEKVFKWSRLFRRLWVWCCYKAVLASLQSSNRLPCRISLFSLQQSLPSKMLCWFWLSPIIHDVLWMQQTDSYLHQEMWL